MIGNHHLSVSDKQKLYADIIKFDVINGRVSIAKELEHFISYSKAELPSLEPYPQVRQYRAAQILNVLDRAWLLEFNNEGLHQMRSSCLAALDLVTEAGAAMLEERPVFQPGEVMFGNDQILAGLGKSIGEKVRWLLRKIMRRSRDAN